MPMGSSYGIRLYELCLQWVGVGCEPEFEIDEFRELLGLGDKYKAVKDLRVRVINPAIIDINKHSKLRVTVNSKKCRRRITHLQFKIIEKSATSPAAIPGTPKRKLTKRELERQARPGETGKMYEKG